MVLPDKQPLDRIQGAIERVTFHNEDTGFCVLRTHVKGHRDLVTVIGSAATVSAGEYIDAEGVWVNDKKHGLQFQAHQLKIIAPTTLEGIKKYLGSGIVKGIGPYFASKLVKAFGEAIFTVIETTPERLTELGGIGKKRQQKILHAWAEQKSIRHIMVFLHTQGVGTTRAVRIYRTYGESALEKIRENPYRLALDIPDIGFKTADLLAQRLGIPKDSLLRIRAGIRHVLQELCENGHCAAERSGLLTTSMQLLETPVTTAEQALNDEIQAGHVVAETIENRVCIFPKALHHAETASAQLLKKRLLRKPPWGIPDAEKALVTATTKTGGSLSDSQRRAVQTVLHYPVSLITGGPGVGKTTLVKTLILIFQALGLRVMLGAPTGRAAQRLTETTGFSAKTIHRLLEFSPLLACFKHHTQNPLPADVVIIDEASMLDIVLFYHLLKAVPLSAALIFVGDIDQLPSVGSGTVLADLIHSRVIPTVRLTEVFRQAACSQIIVNAYRINQGRLPLPNSSRSSDFYTLYVQTPEELHRRLVELVTQRLPNHYRCDPIHDIQVLTPMNRGDLGSHGLNTVLQSQLNGQTPLQVQRYGTVFALGDKVIQKINNYDKDVFNGDIGFIQALNLQESTVCVEFEGHRVEYSFDELDEISLAYAISIHKSQGSEFPIVVIPVSTQHYVLLARNLLYTGVTRGKKLVVLVAQKQAIAIAVHNRSASRRLTGLSHRLRKDTFSLSGFF